MVQNEPSRFIEELPEQLLDRSYAGGGTKMTGSFGSSAFDRMNGGWSQKSSFEGGWSGGKKAAEDAEKRYGPHPLKKLLRRATYLPKWKKRLPIIRLPKTS
ncbi:hypothetical protein LWM68_03100 [Niabella sp. W65]|nr:hypothetical protein [Niabella sp. W65]MCH7361855.1 hypothetical protein [Niabella sp. W65]ULT45614.1 hypothetical protein KRR40_21640 [Niabella sp. I65]